MDQDLTREQNYPKMYQVLSSSWQKLGAAIPMSEYLFLKKIEGVC